MAQHDYNIANQTFPATRSDINNALAAIQSLNSGATEPTTTTAFMWWVDTSGGTKVLNQRNAANSAFIPLWNIDEGGFVPQSGSSIFAVDSEGSDTYVITLDPVPSALTQGMTINFKANTANTGAATLNVNGLGAKTIKKNKDVDLITGDIKALQLVSVQYDGTNFQMVSQANTVASPIRMSP